MAKIATVIGALKTFLEGLSWTSDDGDGASSFNAVYTSPNYINDDGSPFVVIDDSTASGEFHSICTYRIDTIITIDICVNSEQMELSSDDDTKREEAKLRLREAWDYLKTQLYKVTTWRGTLGVDIAFTPGYSDRFEPDNNLLVRSVTLTVTELISAN